MAIRAALVFGRFILQFFSVFIINMMTFIAFFYLSLFVVRVVLKNSRGTLSFGKSDIINHLHIFLRKCRYQPNTDKQGSNQQQNAFFHLMVSIYYKGKPVLHHLSGSGLRSFVDKISGVSVRFRSCQFRHMRPETGHLAPAPESLNLLLCRFFHHRIQYITDKFNIKSEPVIVVDIFKCAVAIVAGSNQNLGALGLGCEQLLGLNTVALDAF